jgi:hypothetical protein
MVGKAESPWEYGVGSFGDRLRIRQKAPNARQPLKLARSLVCLENPK